MAVSADTLRLAVAAQSAANVAPTAPAFKLIRTTGEGLSFNPTTTQSAELDSRRSDTDSILTGGDVSGDVNFELSKNDAFEDFLSALMCSAWGSVGNAGGSITSDELVVGETFFRKFIEKRFTIDPTGTPLYSYHRFLDCLVNTMSISVSPNEPITGSFGFVGSSMLAPASAEIASSSYADAGTNPVFTAPLVSEIKLDRASGTDIALNTYCFNSFSFNVTNNIRGLTCIGFLGNKSAMLGKCQISISASIYFADDELLNMFLNSEEFAITAEFRDSLAVPNKHSYKFTFPRCKLTSAKVVAGGTGQDLVADCAIQALLPASNPKSQLKITRALITS